MKKQGKVIIFVSECNFIQLEQISDLELYLKAACTGHRILLPWRLAGSAVKD